MGLIQSVVLKYNKKTHVIMMADKSQDLQDGSASWKPRKTQRPAGLRPRKGQCFSSSPKAGKADVSDLRQLGERNCLLVKGELASFCFLPLPAPTHHLFPHVIARMTQNKLSSRIGAR